MFKGRCCWLALGLFLINSLSASAASVAVFDDPAFVDTASSSSGAESDNVQASLSSLGHTVVTFTNIADEIAGHSVVLIPEQENGDLASALSEVERSVLETFIRQGGTLRWTPSLRPRDAIFKLVFREAAHVFRCVRLLAS